MIPLGMLAQRQKAAGGGWTPASLPTLVAWYDAADAATITHSAGSVSQWADKSGNSRDVAQVTAARMPTTGARSLGGHNVLDFDGGDVLTRAAVTLAQPITIAWVGAFDAESTVPRFAVTLGDGDVCHGTYYTPAGWRAYSGQSISGGVVDQSPHVFINIASGASSTIRVDGSVVASGNAGTTGGVRINIGSSRSTLVPGLDLDGCVGELVICGAALAPADMSDLEGYLRAKWGTP